MTAFMRSAGHQLPRLCAIVPTNRGTASHCSPKSSPRFDSSPVAQENTPVSRETVLQTNPSFAINSSDKHFRAKTERSAENQKSRAEMPDGLRIQGENCNDLVLQDFGKRIRPLVIAATERTGQPVQALAGAFGPKGARRTLGRGQTGPGPVYRRCRASGGPRDRTDNGRGFAAHNTTAECFDPAASVGGIVSAGRQRPPVVVSVGQPRIPASEERP